MLRAAPLTMDRKTGAIKMIHVRRAACQYHRRHTTHRASRCNFQRAHARRPLRRLLLTMPDPKPVQWTEAIVDPPTEAAIAHIFDCLIAMPSGADGDGNPEPFAMPLSAAAKSLWIDYYNRHRTEFVGLDDDLAAAWSKLEAYAARFALIFQLCSWAAGDAGDHEVNEASIKAGIALSDWFGYEARRVYSLFSGILRRSGAQRELVELIQRRGARITARAPKRGTSVSRQWRSSSCFGRSLPDWLRTLGSN